VPIFTELPSRCVPGNPLGLEGGTQATSFSLLAGQAHGFIMGVARQPAVRRRYDDVYLFLGLGVVLHTPPAR
jgi:hypothetical protein